MQRGFTSSLALAVALGLLLVLPGFSNPLAGDAAAVDQPVGQAELVAKLAFDQTVARPAQPVQPAPGGLLAVLPAAGHVAEVLVHCGESDGFRGESRAADRSTRPVRAPPVSAV